MSSFQSIRFRLSVQYSAVVFGLGGGLLGLLYWAVSRNLKSQTMMAHLQTGRQVVFDDGRIFIIPKYQEVEVRAIESIYNEVVLNEIARFTLIALLALFLLSLLVGWVMSGRVLKPVEEIATVAREIQASDLSRRIDLDGPDDELTRLADTFDGMLERLDRAFTSQRQFLADTSHDLRTPLAVIRSNVEFVLDDEEASVEEWSKAGGIIKRNAEKMSRMIDDLLAAARLQAGKAQAVEIDLASLVETKAAEYEPVASGLGVEISTQASSAIVSGVEVSLERAYSNLVENACRLSPNGSTICLGSGVKDGWAWLGVQDSGPGLPEDDDNRIGLGLSIVTQIAETHGGALASYPGSGGSGATLVVWLPWGDDLGDHPNESPFTND